MWRKANRSDYRAEPFEALYHCRGCQLGAAHAGEKAVATSEVAEAIRNVCPRCRRLANSRLIGGRLCISCYNRDREARISRNRKGGRPALADALHSEIVAVIEGEQVRTLEGDRVTGIEEVVIAAARKAGGPMFFSRAPASAG